MTDEQRLPIDIHSSKLLDWLISRRHCSKDWQSKVLAIREKIKRAILDMPEDERMVKLLQGSYINYFHCIQIVELLKETEKDTKNFLGYYSSQRMNDWLQIRNLYEKENVYLAEAAQILQRLVQYDIPALKKQIAKCDATAVDCSRKEEEYSKQAVSSKKQYEQELRKIGIEGHHLRREIVSLAADLPAFFETVASEIAQLAPPLEYYRKFREYVHQNNQPASPLLPLCSLIMSQGADVTVFELRRGRKPIRIERPQCMATGADDKASDGDSAKKEDEIDFGDNEEIDFGGGDNIDFGAADDIDFGGISVEGSSADIQLVEDNQVSLDDDVARENEALTLLENLETRTLVIDEINELLTFLLFRHEDESTETSADLYISGIENRPEDVCVPLSTVDSWKRQLAEIYAKLTDPQKSRLFKIHTSPQYVETILESLEQKRSLEDRYERLRSLTVEKRSDTLSTASKAQVELTQIVEATRILQRQIEDEISKKYKGTPVNIMGGIVAALKPT